MIEVRPVQTKREQNIFITFPWRIYKNDPLWIPPILSEREKNMDPARGLFFKGGGIADFYIAWKDGKPAGTIVSSRENRFRRKTCLVSSNALTITPSPRRYSSKPRLGHANIISLRSSAPIIWIGKTAAES